MEGIQDTLLSVLDVPTTCVGRWLYYGAAAYACALVLSWCIRKLTAPGFDVKNKHVFVTGGSTGLGKAFAIQCAQRGAKVTIIARRTQQLRDACREIEEAAVNGGAAHWMSCDVTDENALTAALEQAVKHHGRAIDYLVCCAGAAAPGYFGDVNMATHRRQMDLNYFGTLSTIMAAYPAMMEEKQGTIVIVSSAICFAGMIGYSAYAPSKFALRGLADCLRNEFKAAGIRVSIFFPSTIDTPGLAEENKTKPKETDEIEGTANLISAEDCATHLRQGLAAGDYQITNEAVTEGGRIASNGMAPPTSVFFEAMLSPIMVIVGFFFIAYADNVAKGAKLPVHKKHK